MNFTNRTMRFHFFHYYGFLFQEATNLALRYKMPFPKELGDRVESCRDAHNVIKERANQKLDYILSIQDSYKDGLLESIESLKETVAQFETEYDAVSNAFVLLLPN